MATLAGAISTQPRLEPQAAAMDQRSPAILEFFSNGKMQPSMPQPLKKFYKGEPMALGITQIFIGILEIAFGLVVAFMKHPTNFDVHFSNPYWMGIVYIFSGTLSVTASKDPKIPLVKWMLGMNVVSVVVAGIEIVMLSVSVARPTYYFTCKSYYNRDIPPEICHEVYTIPYRPSVLQGFSSVVSTHHCSYHFMASAFASGCNFRGTEKAPHNPEREEEPQGAYEP